jgi:hypothetical protein
MVQPAPEPVASVRSSTLLAFTDWSRPFSWMVGNWMPEIELKFSIPVSSCSSATGLAAMPLLDSGASAAAAAGNGPAMKDRTAMATQAAVPGPRLRQAGTHQWSGCPFICWPVYSFF